jgi:hypothetical protein
MVVMQQIVEWYTTKKSENDEVSISKNNGSRRRKKIHYSQFPPHTGISNEHVIAIVGSYEKENIAEKKGMDQATTTLKRMGSK